MNSPRNTDSQAHSPFNKSCCLVLFPIWTPWIVAWFGILAVFAILAFLLELLVKIADLFVGDTSFTTFPRLDQFVDSDS